MALQTMRAIFVLLAFLEHQRITRRAEASDQEKAARSMPGGRTGLKIDPRLKQLTSAPVCGC